MAVGVATGVQDTESGLADEHPVDMSPRIGMREDDTTQFFTILSRLESRAAVQVKVNWLEDEYMPILTSLAAAVTSVSQTAWQVAAGEGAYIRATDVLYVASTGEKVSVDSLTGDNLTVTRSIGGVAAQTASISDQIVILGPAAAQGADTGTLKATKRVLGFNYSEITRDPFGFTGTEGEAELYGADDPEREIAKKAVEHKRHLENKLWVGGRDFTSSPPNSKGFMGGVTEFLVTNVFPAFGTLSLSGFDLKMQQIYQDGSLNKVAFMAPTPAGALSRLLESRWMRANEDNQFSKTFGVKVTAFIDGAYGNELPVIVKREWGRYSAAQAKSLGGAIFVLDLDRLARRPFRNRDTRLLPNRQGNGQDQVVWDYMTEMSLELKNESAHGVFYGVTG